jgi:hypothetical protein
MLVGQYTKIGPWSENWIGGWKISSWDVASEMLSSLIPRPLLEIELEVEKSVSRSPLEGLVHLTQVGVGIW